MLNYFVKELFATVDPSFSSSKYFHVFLKNYMKYFYIEYKIHEIKFITCRLVAV